jgi:hypothetical protein
LDRFWAPPPLAQEIRIYGNDTFCLVLQQIFLLELIIPRDDLIFEIPVQGLKRKIFKRTLGDLLDYPLFVKPLTPKLFSAKVYENSEQLIRECEGLSTETAILTSEVVDFLAEARCFVLDNRVLDCAVYEGMADLESARVFAQEIVTMVTGPRAYVLDIGWIYERGWAVIEYNAAWGAGLNGCDAAKVLPAITAASGPVKK